MISAIKRERWRPTTARTKRSWTYAAVAAITSMAASGGCSRGRAPASDVPASTAFTFEATFVRGPGTTPETLTVRGREASLLVTSAPSAMTAVGRYSGIIDEATRAALEQAMIASPAATPTLAADTPAVRCSMTSGGKRTERLFGQPPTVAGLQNLLTRIQTIEKMALAHPREAIELELAAPLASIDAGRRTVLTLRVQNAGSEPFTVLFDGAPSIEAMSETKPIYTGETPLPREWTRVGGATPGVALLHLPAGARAELPVELVIAEAGPAAVRARFDGALGLTSETNESMHFHATLISRPTPIDVR